MSCGDLFLGVLAILFPPIAVWIKRGLCSCDSLLNILLCLLGYIPGLIHAWYIIAKYPDPEYERLAADDAEGARVTYYYVSRDGEAAPAPAPGVAGQPDGGRAHRELQRGGSGYGTIGAASSGGGGGAGAQQQQQASRPAGVAAGPAEGSQSQSRETPPTYAEAVKGDHKVQTP